MGGVVRGREEREGEGKERAMSPLPHYLEEVYAYADMQDKTRHSSMQ